MDGPVKVIDFRARVARVNRVFLGVGNINTDDLDFEFDDVQELFADCDVCAMPARHTQRLIDGKPAHYNSPILAIEGDGPYTYQARCSGCHKVPGVIK